MIAVRDTLIHACQGRPIMLIAVSKLQAIESIKAAYDLGHRDFGENYVQELIEKSQALKESCPEIRWHFIGALQSNKMSLLLRNCAGLWSVETVDSISKFEKIVKALQGGTERTHRVQLFLQVNISEEESKHGLKTKEELIQIYRHHLHLQDTGTNLNYTLEGLMMIGEIEASERDFAKMIRLRQELAEEVGWAGCKLSMGMSGDYELAARMGTDIVRIGSAIFGDRHKQD